MEIASIQLKKKKKIEYLLRLEYAALSLLKV